MGLRTRLETLGANSNHINTITKVGPRSVNTNIDKLSFAGLSSSSPGAGLESPGWVSEVGVGREWDKVSGYWRFSDLVRVGDPGFCNSGTPGCRGVILDLSKYGNPLEIFGGCTSEAKVMTSFMFTSKFYNFFYSINCSCSFTYLFV